MNKHLGYFIMTYELLEEALRRAYGMPEDAHILDMTIDHTTRTLLVKVEHPDLPERREGEQVPELKPHIHYTENCPQFDWGKQ